MLLPWSHTFAFEGLTLRGWRTAPRGRPLLHFLHGNGFSSRTYEPMLTELARDFDLWLCDLPGHGDSDPGPAFLGWNENARLALLAFEAGRPQYGDVAAYSVGHSFGGGLTALMNAEPHRPFAASVLLDPVLLPPAVIGMVSALQLARAEGLFPMSRAARRRRPAWPDRQSAFAALKGRGAYAGWTDESLRAFIDHGIGERSDGTVGLKCQPALEATIYCSRPRGLWRRLASTTIPIRLLQGAETMSVVRLGARRAIRLNPRLSRVITDGGHCFMQQRPEATARSIRDFLVASAA